MDFWSGRAAKRHKRHKADDGDGGRGMIFMAII
jgi:hypothetical protein